MTYLPSNRRLLERFRAGEPSAMAEVYDHYAPDLARYLRTGFSFDWQGQPGRFRGYGTPLELSDAVQESFARAFTETARLGYDGLKPFGAYLAGIARNVVLDQFRKQQVAATALTGFSLETENREPPETPDMAAEEIEAARLVTDFVESLEPAEKTLYRVRFIETRGQEEAAQLIGLSRIQLRRAELKLRRRLLEHLKQNGYLEDFGFQGWGLVRLQTSPSTRRSDS